jgi:hypothetical protein
MPMFPEMDFTGLDEETLEDGGLPSSEKWTYVIDYERRRIVTGDDGRPKRTRTYREYIEEVAKKILNTERFRYFIYDDTIGVEKSEWSTWEDGDIRRDIEEALVVHEEIERAEVLNIIRESKRMLISLRLTGKEEIVETEVGVANATG